TPDDLYVEVEDPDAGFFEVPRVAIGIGGNDGVLLVTAPSTQERGRFSMDDISVKRFAFADGTVLGLDDIIARADSGVIGTQFGEGLLLGSVTNDTIIGGFSDDILAGRGSDDELFSGIGD